MLAQTGGPGFWSWASPSLWDGLSTSTHGGCSPKACAPRSHSLSRPQHPALTQAGPMDVEDKFMQVRIPRGGGLRDHLKVPTVLSDSLHPVTEQ